MGSAIFHLVILLLSIFPAFARSSVCSIGSLRVDPNGVVSTSYFTVKIKCSSKNVEINWRKITGENRDEEYYEEYFSAVSFLMCKDTSGNEITKETFSEEFTNGLSGTLMVNASNITTCITYGCHSFGTTNAYYTENSTCTTTKEIHQNGAALTSSSALSTIVKTEASSASSSSAAIEQSTSILPNTESTSHLESGMSPTVPVAPMESRLTTSQRVQPDVSTRKLSSVSPPSLTSPNFEQSSISLMYLWLFGAIGFLLVVGLSFAGCTFVFYHNKIRRKRSKQSVFHTWNLHYFEKIDPHFIPIEVDQRLKKHESTTSIIEHLNQPKRLDSEQKEILHVLPQHPSCVEDQQPHKKTTTIPYPERFVLHTPSIRECHTSPTHEHLQETTLCTTTPCHSQPHLPYHGSMDIAHQDLVVAHSVNDIQMQEYNDMFTSSNVDMTDYYWDTVSHDDQGSPTITKDLSQDSNSTIFKTDIECMSDYNFSTTSRNCVMLNFAPSPLTNSSDVIYLDSLPSTSGQFQDKQSFCEGITEQNFHIDPRHFDPL